MIDASKNVTKITKVGLPAEHSFLDCMARYLYSSGGPGRKGNS
jgi:hypothetical protein